MRVDGLKFSGSNIESVQQAVVAVEGIGFNTEIRNYAKNPGAEFEASDWSDSAASGSIVFSTTTKGGEVLQGSRSFKLSSTDSSGNAYVSAALHTFDSIDTNRSHKLSFYFNHADTAGTAGGQFLEMTEGWNLYSCSLRSL